MGSVSQDADPIELYCSRKEVGKMKVLLRWCSIAVVTATLYGMMYLAIYLAAAMAKILY